MYAVRFNGDQSCAASWLARPRFRDETSHATSRISERAEYQTRENAERIAKRYRDRNGDHAECVKLDDPVDGVKYAIKDIGEGWWLTHDNDWTPHKRSRALFDTRDEAVAHVELDGWRGLSRVVRITKKSTEKDEPIPFRVNLTIADVLAWITQEVNAAQATHAALKRKCDHADQYALGVLEALVRVENYIQDSL